MCRLAAFPPKTSPDVAHHIISEMQGGNEHGVGVAYLKGKSFVIQKYPIGYKEALVQKKPLFDHMPYEGWTIAHVRFATHGAHTYVNTHPIIRGDMAVVHNGVFNLSYLVKAALHKSVKWQGETDTEVGAYMLNSLGPEEFYKALPAGNGVWLALHRDGSLSATKLSGDLELYQNENETLILSSEFPWKGGWKSKSRFCTTGTMRLTPEGHPADFSVEKKTYGITPTKQGYGSYTEKDVSRPPSCGTPQLITNSSQMANYGGPRLTAAKEEEIELWNWPDEERMIEYLRNLK